MRRASRGPSIAIIGAGLSGLAMAMRLQQAGIDTFTIFEKSDGAGGTWRQNRYPGAACDVPSHLYSFSFEPAADWSRVFPRQAKILSYVNRSVRRHNLEAYIRFNTEVTHARFDDARREWRLRTAGGEEHRARVLICACGQLSRPRYPEVEGRLTFRGVQFHSANWQPGCDLSDQVVGVVGTGASAAQLIPAIAPRVRKLYVFQRTPVWVLPKPDRRYTRIERLAFRRVPFLRHLYRALIYWALETRVLAFRRSHWLQRHHQRLALTYLHRSVEDPARRRALTPDYPVGCKRIVLSNDYYAALCRGNVELVTSPIARMTADGVVTRDGVSRKLDAIVYATGFETTAFLAPLSVVGRRGLSLEDAWTNGAEAYLGMLVSGFPNLFLLYGPNTNLAHNSILFMVECQVRYILRCIRHLGRNPDACVDVDPQRLRTFGKWIRRRHARRVWSACQSWYLDESGANSHNWPDGSVAYWWRTRWLGPRAQLFARSDRR